jgi:hypothetical protein
VQQLLVAYSVHVWQMLTTTLWVYKFICGEQLSTYLNYVCSIKTVYTIDSENTLLLAKYNIIGEPEITRTLLEFRTKMFEVGERTLAFQLSFPYYRSGFEYFHTLMNRSLYQVNSDFNDLLHALRLRMKIIFAVSMFGAIQ